MKTLTIAIEGKHYNRNKIKQGFIELQINYISFIYCKLQKNKYMRYTLTTDLGRYCLASSVGSYPSFPHFC